MSYYCLLKRNNVLFGKTMIDIRERIEIEVNKQMETFSFVNL